MLLLLVAFLAGFGVSAHYFPSQNIYENGQLDDIYQKEDYFGGYKKYDRPRPCPNLETYIGNLVTVSSDAFYEPIIRYVNDHGDYYAIVTCDANRDTVNLLFGRNNTETDVRKSNFISFGTSTGVALKCDETERSFFEDIFDPKSITFSKNVKVEEVTCLRLDRTSFGFAIEGIMKKVENYHLENALNNRRKKRQAPNKPAEGDDDTKVENSSVVNNNGEKPSKSTDQNEKNPSKSESTDQNEKNPSKSESTDQNEKNPSKSESTDQNEKNPSKSESTDQNEKNPSKSESTGKNGSSASKNGSTGGKKESSKQQSEKIANITKKEGIQIALGSQAVADIQEIIKEILSQ
ncbi:unnamed protein product [Caenorhabditis bovis]|uniref:Uncharacterized protein n=1 Tax=Caenorhabditis bovis TaxID=2654633 RepID=A0A8S1EB99_9PELO|nr:unnamed protein product [Caenorhabditis bovis]